MFPRRMPRPGSQSSFTDSERNLILAAETLRHGDGPTKSVAHEKPEERISVFWRLFGGTVLSICALVMINAYQSLASNIHDVRGDLSRLRDAASEFIRKDDFNNRTTTLWTTLRDLQNMQGPVSVLTNKLAALEQQATGWERDHKEVVTLSAALATLREKDALLDKLVKEAETERRDLAREVQALRERIAKLEGQAEKKPPSP